MLEVGRRPDTMTVPLVRDAGFTQPFEADTDYPVGATMTLVVKLDDGTVVATWNATIAGKVATFSQTAAAVNTVLNTAGQKTAWLYYDEPSAEPVAMGVGPVREYKERA